MTTPASVSIPALTGWALILGASSGFGEAVGSFLARAGCHIIGIHLDRRATMSNVERIQNEAVARIVAAIGGSRRPATPKPETDSPGDEAKAHDAPPVEPATRPN